MSLPDAEFVNVARHKGRVLGDLRGQNTSVSLIHVLDRTLSGEVFVELSKEGS
jgi:hypothetical protein